MEFNPDLFKIENNFTGSISYDGIDLKISRELLHDLRWISIPEAEQIIIDAYNSSIQQIRDTKLNQILPTND